jgi:methyl-accepting chemotaxis protein
MENIASLTKKLKEQALEIEKLSKTVEELTERVKLQDELIANLAETPAFKPAPATSEQMFTPANRVEQLERILARVMHQTGTATLLKNTTIKPFEPTKKDMSKYDNG